MPQFSVWGAAPAHATERCCAGFSRRDALTELGLHRYCCRRMVLTHVDLIDKLLNYNGDKHKEGAVSPCLLLRTCIPRFRTTRPCSGMHHLYRCACFPFQPWSGGKAMPATGDGSADVQASAMPSAKKAWRKFVVRCSNVKQHDIMHRAGAAVFPRRKGGYN